MGERAGWLAAAVAAICGLACGGVSGMETDAAAPPDVGEPPDVAQPPDAGDGPDAVLARCNPTAPFATVVPVTELNTDGPYDENARLSPDELTVYFSSGRDNTSLDIYVADRATREEPFGAPRLLEGVNTTAFHERQPSVTGDGLSIYALRNAPGHYEMVLAQRPSQAVQFGALDVLANVNDPTLDQNAPFVLQDGSALYFASNRAGDWDIYRAACSATGCVDPQPVASVNTAGLFDDSPVLTPDELTIYFASEREGGGIFRARRTSIADGFGTPALVSEVTTPDNSEWPTWVSADDCVLYFTRTDGPTAVNYDIYEARRGM
jgi:hypothetical protein